MCWLVGLLVCLLAGLLKQFTCRCIFYNFGKRISQLNFGSDLVRIWIKIFVFTLFTICEGALCAYDGIDRCEKFSPVAGAEPCNVAIGLNAIFQIFGEK